MTKNKSAKLGFTPQDARGEIIRFPGYLISADRKITFKDCKEYTDARDIRAELSPADLARTLKWCLKCEGRGSYRAQVFGGPASSPLATRYRKREA
jgi:hypothetical protein